jgi:hypothetical protein
MWRPPLQNKGDHDCGRESAQACDADVAFGHARECTPRAADCQHGREPAGVCTNRRVRLRSAPAMG